MRIASSESVEKAYDAAFLVDELGSSGFEDFLRAPEAVVRAICTTVDLPYRPDLVPRPGDRFPFATLPTDTKWYPLREDSKATHVRREALDIIDARCGELATRLGYGPDGEGAPADPGLLITS